MNIENIDRALRRAVSNVAACAALIRHHGEAHRYHYTRARARARALQAMRDRMVAQAAECPEPASLDLTKLDPAAPALRPVVVPVAPPAKPPRVEAAPPRRWRPISGQRPPQNITIRFF